MTKNLLFGLLAVSFLFYAPQTFGTTYIASTIADITADVAKSASGDTILIRAGTYATTQTIKLSMSGTSAKPCCCMVYPGDQRPTLDFSGMSAGSSNRGVILSGSYWHIKGIIIKGAGDNGMNVSGDNNVIEFCDFCENQDSGLQLGGGATNNQIINCDSYFNKDPGQGNADGFSPKLDVGTGNYFRGCRSWQNSDDGYDGYLRPSDDITTTFENCWCFKNGYLKDGSASSGNGNGFKMGGSDNKDLRHNQILKNCLSAGNRVKGFDQNNNIGSMTLYNCTAFNNGANYSIDASKLASGKTLTVTNCVSAGSGGVSLTGGTITTCSWSSGLSVSNSDFVSVDQAQLTTARKADGGLPDITFMHLRQTDPKSTLIDAGTVITGMTYNGLRPDLGCFETGSGTGTFRQTAAGVLPQPFMRLSHNIAGLTKVTLDFPAPATASIGLFTATGRKVVDLGEHSFSSGHSELILDIRNLGPGEYLCRLNAKRL
jgi:hypothetical protein